MTFAWRRTACRMRHCFARRIVETGGRRELLRTSTRWVERQRIIEAEANRIAMPTRQRRAQAVQSASIAALRAARLQCENLSLGGFKGGYSLLRKRISPFARSPAGTQGFSVCLDKQFQSWYAERNKGSEKEAFSFHPLKRGDGRCKSLRNGKGGAFEPRGGNAAPVPPLQGNEVPRIQRGIQVEPRTMICSP